MGKVANVSGFTYDWLKKWHKTFWTNKQALLADNSWVQTIFSFTIFLITCSAKTKAIIA